MAIKYSVGPSASFVIKVSGAPLCLESYMANIPV